MEHRWRRYVCGVLGLVLACALPAPAQAVGGQRAQVSAALDRDALQAGHEARLAVVIDIQPGFHAQSHEPLSSSLIKTQVSIEENPAFTAGEAVYPPGQIVEYPALGKLSVYSGRTILYVPLRVKNDAAPGPTEIRGRVVYQICDEKQCYAPQRPTFTLPTRVVGAGETVNAANGELFAAASQPGTAGTLFGWQLGDDAYLLAFLGAFVVGILFNFMPCVLPVVPLKAVGFYEVSQHHRGKSLRLGAVFSLGVVASFGVLAVLVVVLHTLAWGQLYTNPWFLGAIVLILGVMALSMFGAFDVGLPTWVYRITPRHDTYGGNLAFGVLTAVLSTPCTFGMFLTLLIWATKQPPALGAALVMMVGVGMAAPYLVLSAFPELARRFPRTGPWALVVKEMMGFLLLASAAYFARRFVAGTIGNEAYWWLLFAVVAAAAVWLMVRVVQFSKTRIGVVVGACMALAMVAPALAVTLRLGRPAITWQAYSEAALEQATREGRPVLVEFTADWCGNCIVLEATALHDRAVVQAIKQHRVVALRADVTEEDAAGWTLLRKLNPVAAIPLTVIYSGVPQHPLQLAGIYSGQDLVHAIQQAAEASVARATGP